MNIGMNRGVGMGMEMRIGTDMGTETDMEMDMHMEMGMETETELDMGMDMGMEMDMDMGTETEMGMGIKVEIGIAMEMGMRNASCKMQHRQTHHTHASRFPNTPPGFSNTHPGSPTHAFGVRYLPVLFNYY